MSLVPGFYNHFYQLGKFLSVFIYIAGLWRLETGQQPTVKSGVRPPTQSNLLLFADCDCYTVLSSQFSQLFSLLIKAELSETSLRPHSDCRPGLTGGDGVVEGRLGHQRLPGKTGPRDGHTSSTPSNVKGAAGPHCQSWDCGTESQPRPGKREIEIEISDGQWANQRYPQGYLGTGNPEWSFYLVAGRTSQVNSTLTRTAFQLVSFL